MLENKKLVAVAILTDKHFKEIVMNNEDLSLTGIQIKSESYCETIPSIVFYIMRV